MKKTYEWYWAPPSARLLKGCDFGIIVLMGALPCTGPHIALCVRCGFMPSIPDGIDNESGSEAHSARCNLVPVVDMSLSTKLVFPKFVAKVKCCCKQRA